MPHRRELLLAGAVAALGLPLRAVAHHGWAWATEEDISLSGTIRAARLGNPHGELEIEAADGVWLAEIGQPWRNARAGLTDAMLAPGTEVTIEGPRSLNPEERVVKAERVIIAGTLYDLYPDRS